MTRVVPETKAVARGSRILKSPQLTVEPKRPPEKPAGRTSLLTIVLVVGVLYFARVVFMPIALAVLLAFLLGPLVERLRHVGLQRVPSVLIAVVFSLLILVVIGGLMASQMSDLARKLPEYQQNMDEKVQTIRTSGGGLINRVTRFVHNVTEEFVPAPAPATPRNRPAEEKPVPVEIRQAPFAPFDLMQKVLGSVLNVVLMTGIVIVFVLFMLFQRDDLRDRLIRLVGAGRVNLTTQAFNDAGSRLSRYLLAQLCINAGFGVLAGIALVFIGVPNPLLWGMLAALLRYVPYLGIWVAAAMPAALAFAIDPGWMKLILVFAVYVGIDVLMYNVAEPVLYGSSTGVSPMAILVAAVFWTWLWGPVGLLLATPLTVCLVVIGRYVPSLEFLSVMLSDEPVLTPEIRFYQRMLAMDLEGSALLGDEFLKGKPIEEFYDQVVVRALILAEEDRHRGTLDEEQQEFILQNTRFLVEDMAERADEIAAGNTPAKPKRPNGKLGPAAPTNGSGHETSATAVVACIPARDEADEIAASMLAQLLAKRGVSAKVLSADALASECVEQVGRAQIKIACVLAIPPYGYTHARYLCRRLRNQFPDLKLVASVLTERDIAELRERKPAITADELASSLQQALTAALSFVPGPDQKPTAPAPVLTPA